MGSHKFICKLRGEALKRSVQLLLGSMLVFMTMIGLARGTVQLQQYFPEWKTLFELEADLLRSAMGAAAQHVEHVGSTAIDGMSAKPIIDLVVVVSSLNEAGVWIPRLQALGYEHRASDVVADRLFFAKGPQSRRTHHLSLAEAKSKFYTEKVLFRAFDEYLELKKKLAQRYPKDRDSYTEGKRGFVEGIIQLAKGTSSQSATERIENQCGAE